MTYTIKQATHQELLQIAALDAVVWRRGRGRDFTVADGEHAWKKWIEYALVFCARSNQGKVTGVVVAFPTIKNGWCIHKLFVDSVYRKAGIGRHLLEVLLKQIDRKESKVFLSVDPLNQAAIRLYKSNGFVIKELKPGYYREYEDRYMMVRPVQWADRKERLSRPVSLKVHA